MNLTAPRLKPTVDVRSVGGRLLVLRADLSGRDFELDGDVHWIAAFLEMLDGTRSLGGLQEELSGRGLRHDPETVGAALTELSDAGLLEDAAEASDLSAYELERYSRQLAYFADIATSEVSAPVAQQRLGGARVAVLGVGGLGSWAALGLASSGIGFLRLVDGDRLELSNLNRQILYAEADIGRQKAEAAAEHLRAFSPAIEVEAHVERLAGPAGVGRVVEGCDLVLDAADWPAHSIDRWVNEACTTRSIPHLTMSQHPPNLRVGPLYVPGVSGCFACRETQFRAQYAEYDALAASAPAASQAATFGPACAAVGAFAAAEAVHFLTGLLDPATIGRALTIDLRDLTTSWEEVTAVADCPVCARIPNSPSAIAN